jgi:ABC-2 type transport system permease protein
LWGVVAGAVVSSSASGFAAAYPTADSRRQLARSLGGNSGLQALFGTARRLDTVAGFTAWRSMGLITVIGAAWGLLSSTRRLRGEEEVGRWELLLSGPTTQRTATAATRAMAK